MALNAIILGTGSKPTSRLHTDVTLTAVGVMITLDRDTSHATEVLIPFGSGRVLEVYPDTAGELHNAFVTIAD